MTPRRTQSTAATLEVDLFFPQPNTLYSLEATAHLARVSRRTLLVYCRFGLVQPVFQAPYGVMTFTDESIQIVRQIEYLRRDQSLNIYWIKGLLNLVDEVKQLRREVRFLRPL